MTDPTLSRPGNSICKDQAGEVSGPGRDNPSTRTPVSTAALTSAADNRHPASGVGAGAGWNPSVLRPARRPRPRRTYSTAWLALPVALSAMFGVWAIVVDDHWATGLGFLFAGAFIAWGFRNVR